MATIIPDAPEIENLEDNIPITQAQDVETLIRQKKQEITVCMTECNRLRGELQDLKNLCTEGGQCNWSAHQWHGSHGTKKCSKCGRTGYEYSKGGRRKSRRKSRRRRKYKKRKTKRRRR